MNSQLETRVRKLEAKCDAANGNVFDELSPMQMKALLVLLEAEDEARERNCSAQDIITDELLYKEAMSRQSFDAALQSVAVEKWHEMLRSVEQRH
jgi:hypothetical protein